MIASADYRLRWHAQAETALATVWGLRIAHALLRSTRSCRSPQRFHVGVYPRRHLSGSVANINTNLDTNKNGTGISITAFQKWRTVDALTDSYVSSPARPNYETRQTQGREDWVRPTLAFGVSPPAASPVSPIPQIQTRSHIRHRRKLPLVRRLVHLPEQQVILRFRVAISTTVTSHTPLLPWLSFRSPRFRYWDLPEDSMSDPGKRARRGTESL